MTRIVAPSRLHFGLLSLASADGQRWPGLDGNPGLPTRRFGGVGLMIDRPALAVRVSAADEFTAAGPAAARALSFTRRMVATLPSQEQRPFRVAVEFAPPEHTGLGVGTQLGLAIAKGIAVETGHADWPAFALAQRIGRGERSAIGVHGFDHGGLIVEAGKLPGDVIAPIVGRYAFPPDWTILLCSPPCEAAWHGGSEREAFDRLVGSTSATDVLCRIVLTGLLPALALADFNAFGAALYEFNARAGDAFAAVQGGRYASPIGAECVARLQALGVRGVGQSSWGPTVFALVRRDAARQISECMADIPNIVAHGSAGAVVDSLDR